MSLVTLLLLLATAPSAPADSTPVFYVVIDRWRPAPKGAALDPA